MQVNSTRNPDGWFINTLPFSEAGNRFLKHGYYTSAPWGSLDWKEYWEEEVRRCTNGYSVGGVWITGNHYNYLNYSPIMRSKDITGNNKGGQKVKAFPAFYDGDYNYFHILEIAFTGCTKEFLDGLQLAVNPTWLDGNKHLIVGKARRKGYSYKNASIAANRYNTQPDSITLLGASDKKFLYPEGTMGMVTNNINFYSENTAWGKKRDFVDRQEHRKASYEETTNIGKIEKGYKSQVIALSFKDNPDAARGKDGSLLFFEEAGKFPNLKASYKATLPAFADGKFLTGQMIIFGTGKGEDENKAGDVGNDWRDFAEMFYNPNEYNLLPFENIWDEDSLDNVCGFFHPNSMNLPGFIDSHGNSLIKEAQEFEIKERKSILANSSSGAHALNGRLQEYPESPEQAFLLTSNNDFPTVELRNQLTRVLKDNLYKKYATPVVLYRDENNKVNYKVDLLKQLKPVVHWKPKVKDLKGCIIMYEPPIKNASKGTYKLGHDPYRQNSSNSSPSLGATFVHKGHTSYGWGGDTIVAEYIGRPSTPDEYNRQMEMLAELYGGEIMHENEVTEVRNYFRRRKKLHLLAAQPDDVINATIANSKVSRIYGIHMVEKLKDAALKYIKSWLLEEHQVKEDGTKVLNLHRIYSIGLLEELIGYDRLKDKKGSLNYDRLIALAMILFARQQEDEGKKHDKGTKHNTAQALLEMMHQQYKKQSGLTKHF